MKFFWNLYPILLISLALTSCSTTAQPGQSQGTDKELESKVLEIIRKNPQVILESVEKYGKEQKEKQESSQKSVLQGMKNNPKSVVKNSPTKGAPDQKIVLLMFSDFQCPYCAAGHETVNQFIEKHKDKVTLVYKHLPLTKIHPQAMNAAKASWAALQQGKFWEFSDALFKQQDKLGEQFYVDTAKSLQLDLEKFNKDRKSEAANGAIQEDMKMAEELGVPGTPFLVMNGEAFRGAADVGELEATLKKVGG
jgi:protein-disulfide isomerase